MLYCFLYKPTCNTEEVNEDAIRTHRTHASLFFCMNLQHWQKKWKCITINSCFTIFGFFCTYCKKPSRDTAEINKKTLPLRVHKTKEHMRRNETQESYSYLNSLTRNTVEPVEHTRCFMYWKTCNIFCARIHSSSVLISKHRLLHTSRGRIYCGVGPWAPVLMTSDQILIIRKKLSLDFLTASAVN